jgi:hypothetical protein
VPAMGIVEPARRNKHTAASGVVTPSRRSARWPWLLAALALVVGLATVLLIREFAQNAADSLTGSGEAEIGDSPPAIVAQKPVAKVEKPEVDDRGPEDTGPSRIPVDPDKSDPTEKPRQPESDHVKPLPAPPPRAVKKPQPKPTPPKAIVGPELRLEWKLKRGGKFYQEMGVVQKPTFSVQGIPVTSSLQYTVVSFFIVEEAKADRYVVRQKVEAARLVEADPLTQGLLAPMIVKLPGTAFTIELNARMEVTRFAGASDKVKMGGINLAGVQGLQMASLLDMDGWKEMAQLTFFQPNRTLQPQATWTQPLTHNWGPLGIWTGKSRYTYAGREKALHKIDYVLDLTHQAPKAGGLVTGAAFRTRAAGGTILFDADKGKVTAASERFRVGGRLNINLLGQNTPVDIEEDQLFLLRIMDAPPP